MAERIDVTSFIVENSSLTTLGPDTNQSPEL